MTDKNEQRVALVLGAQGIIGRNVVEHLRRRPNWTVRGAARRRPPEAEGEYLIVDLLDEGSIREKLAAASDTTHLVFAAYQEHAAPADQVKINVAMLRNALDALEAIGAPLQHTTLYQGGKAYGAHLGPYKTPARESDPRLLGPNFYYDQEDLLRERSARGGWACTFLRPDAMLGVAFGNPMNLFMAIAVYATITRELGLPLRFPGTQDAYVALTQATDAQLLARATEWAGMTPAASGEIYNVIDGDQFRWQEFFPIVADDFGMAYAGVQPMKLADHMPDKEPVWNRIVERYGLRPMPYAQMASWPFADGQFSTGYDLVQSTIKIRQAGFHDCVDTFARYRQLLTELREERYLPPIA